VKTPLSEQFLQVALYAAEKASLYISNESTRILQVNFKGKTDLVTQVDHGSEKIILDEINHYFPDHNVLTEESGEIEGKSPYTWIIDPLDGTTNFVHKYPFYAVSIAAYHEGNPLVGVVADVYHHHIYSAVKGGGAFRNGKPIHVSKTKQLQYSLLATGFPYIHDQVWDKNFDYLKIFTGLTQGVRRAGAASIDLAHVACGWLDGFWEFGLKPWDSSAGILLVEEAGGKISKMDGSDFSIYVPEIIASNGIIHGEMIKHIQLK